MLNHMAKDRRKGFLEHPENDLSIDADFANLRPPEPHSLEELATSEDPVVAFERNQYSTRQAIIYAVASPVILLVFAAILAFIFRLQGGEFCDNGPARFICSRQAQLWWPIMTSIVALASPIGCAIIMVYKLRHYTRWRPWMGAFWFLVPMSMLWMTTVLPIAILGKTMF
ncbi:hypothetical protein SAMN05660282_01900 [Corynebacterium spheniscorum]|uniref:Uncharacterized protein n=2 Tax=Corynebacterium spheniscorum TaxID=185761 RepID=A0A1I2UJ80_9CORY|nr:hypothetical protein SAMN05660282_01900 [Corynebacterium spheniscorum]